MGQYPHGPSSLLESGSLRSEYDPRLCRKDRGGEVYSRSGQVSSLVPIITMAGRGV